MRIDPTQSPPVENPNFGTLEEDWDEVNDRNPER